MKELELQIKFLDKTFLPACGINSIVDYGTTISAFSLEHRLNDINAILKELRKVFPVKKFNLHKTNYKITSGKQAFSIAKICLSIACIPFEAKNTNAMRLLEENFLLTKIRKEKRLEMAEIRPSLSDECTNAF